MKKTKHVPKEGAANKNIIRCILLSTEDNMKLTAADCKIEETHFQSLISILVEQGIIKRKDKKKEIIDTSDAIISDYMKAEYYTVGRFETCLKRIETDIIPFVNLAVEIMKAIN